MIESNVTALKLNNIIKVYGSGDTKVEALKGINLNFRKSEFVSILGPSGCGKTTLLNIIGGLDRYTSGDLLIGGVSTKEYHDGDWDTYRNNSIGFVFQSYNLIPHQTVLSNVELALTLSGVSKSERKRRAKKALADVGLNGLYHKLPNQMSGGQMQRVAIARALVNDPDIILADEPTGALDSETSVQIMELLKKVAEKRLVIMVTHNPDLAEKYSSRIIRLFDGKMVGDTNPLLENETLEKEKTEKDKKEKKSKTHMGLFTAFMLSMSNLRTKRGRTALTAIAGSIGIIGIALVLALSTGFSSYINKLQADTLSVYPLTISEATIDLSDFQNLVEKEGVSQEIVDNTIYTREMFGKLTNMLKSNKLSSEYISYVKNYVDEKNEVALSKNSWAYCLKKEYGLDVNNYIYANIEYMNQNLTMPVDNLVRSLESMFNAGMENSNMNIDAEFVREYIPTMSELPDSIDLLNSQYDVLCGKWATEADEMVLVVNQDNQVMDITLALLGFNSIDGINTTNYSMQFGSKSTFTYDEVLNKEFYYVKNDNRYVKIADGIYQEKTIKDGKYVGTEINFTPDLTLKITGVVRLKDSVKEGVLEVGLGYTSKFVNDVVLSDDNLNSQIVAGTSYMDGDEQKQREVTVKTALNQSGDKFSKRALAGDKTISKLSIYSADYEKKEEIKTYLDAWNNIEGRNEEDEVHYSDSTAMLFYALNTVVDSVKIVLIAFTAISLVVSSIMIGIITYVSVVERTKEIGVLRSLGARKKDISRIFNAETFIIGLIAGLIGIGFTYLISIPINIIIASFVANIGKVASLKILDALILVCVSFVLTLIAGVIPARIAAKKDPVVALRTE